MDILLIHTTAPAKLAAVTAEMETLGAPTIRAVRDHTHGVLVALEGCHRLSAAHDLGVDPDIVVLDDDAPVSLDDIGLDDSGYFGGERVTAGQIRDWLARDGYAGQPMLRFDFCPTPTAGTAGMED
jgi:hypothetical protein